MIQTEKSREAFWRSIIINRKKRGDEMVWNVKDLNQRVQDQDSRMWISQVEAEARLNRKNLAARIARNPEIRFLL